MDREQEVPRDRAAVARAPHEPFQARRYEVCALPGGPGTEVPWTMAAWTRVRNGLDPLLRRCSGPAALRTRQLRPGPGSPNQRSISFGRIVWSGAGADKWTHEVDGRLAATGDAAEFVSCEAWAPSWTTASRTRRPPGLYLGIAGRDHPPFRFVCVLAVATGVAADGQAPDRAGTLAGAVGAVLRARCARPWGLPIGGGFHTRAINDLTTVGLPGTGPIGGGAVPSPALLDGDWDTF